MLSPELFAGTLQLSVQRLGIVMEPDGSPLEVEGVLNPGATRDRAGNLLLYPRIVAAGNVSRIGLARVKADGTLERLGTVLEPSTDYERRDVAGGHGCEDARVTYIAEIGLFVMAYTAFGPSGARIAIATSEDARAWRRLGLVHFPGTGLNAVDNKDAAFFPEPVWSPAGIPSLAFFHRPMRPETINGQTPIATILALPLEEREALCIAYIPVDAVKRDIGNLCAPLESVRVLDPGAQWGSLKNGAGTPPIRTRLGWLSVFHGVDAIDGPDGKSLLYRAGIVVNDPHSPHRVLYRSPEPILAPLTASERYGTVNNVVFPTGIDEIDPATFDVYYGAADAKISRARFTLERH